MRNGTTTKQRIERTALGLFARKGIRETTIRDIATAARIAEGTMYRHYRSKDDLAHDLFVTNYVALGKELRQVQAKEATAENKIRAMIRYFCTVYEQDPDMFTYLFLARHDHMRSIDSRMANPYLVFRRVIRDGMNRGEIPTQDPDVAASMVMGVVLQVIDSRLLGDRIRKSISALAGTLADASWRVLQVS
jgi:AcrR family transcriptional regulator